MCIEFATFIVTGIRGSPFYFFFVGLGYSNLLAFFGVYVMLFVLVKEICTVQNTFQALLWSHICWLHSSSLALLFESQGC
jgi:hypothetical protein